MSESTQWESRTEAVWVDITGQQWPSPTWCQAGDGSQIFAGPQGKFEWETSWSAPSTDTNKAVFLSTTSSMTSREPIELPSPLIGSVTVLHSGADIKLMVIKYSLFILDMTLVMWRLYLDGGYKIESKCSNEADRWYNCRLCSRCLGDIFKGQVWEILLMTH